MPRLPNLLATRRGRLAAFFGLYVTEGIPLGFAATAVATELRRRGVGPAEIGAFVASFYLPWAFKWAVGPFVDVFRSKRFGHRRGWILFAQLAMVATLAVLAWVPLPSGLALFTAILLVHNSFGALQDVAIDSLAVNTLGEDERGLANGLMFAGAAIGQAVGGSGVLLLTRWLPFQSTFLLVAASVGLVTLLVTLPMKEAAAAGQPLPAGVSRLRAALAEMRQFAAQSFRAFVGSSGAYRGVFFALLPAGAMSLGLALQSNLAVELGMDNDAVGSLNLWSAVVSAAAMVAGGWLSDRFGRRRMLALFMAGMSLPVLWLAGMLHEAGYVMPRAPGAPAVPALILQLWIANTSYSVFQGLMYGTNSAIMMDITNPRVAATQFTAYMAMMNFAISFAAGWQGIAIEAWGYPATLLVDALVGPIGCLLLPRMTPARGGGDGQASARAQRTAFGLALAVLSFLAWWPLREHTGAAQPLCGTFYTLVFVASAMFLLASREVLGESAGRWGRAARWVAPLLLALYGRYWLADIASPALRLAATIAMDASVAAAGLVLLALARRPWAGHTHIEAAAPLAPAEPAPAA